MKKVLVLSASPRIGGNSDVLCDEFIKGVKENHHDVEKIYVNKLKMGYCQACYVCRKTKKCFQNDDMEEILNKMIEADVIVMATPVYFYSMDAQLKTLIDRTLPRYTEITNKDFYFIATAAANKTFMERTMDSMRGFTDCLDNVSVKGVIYGAGAWNKGDILDTEAMKEAYFMGKGI